MRGEHELAHRFRGLRTENVMQRRITRTTVRTDRRARAEIASSLFICLALLSPTVPALGVEPPPVEWSANYDGRAPSSGNYVEPVDGGFVVACCGNPGYLRRTTLPRAKSSRRS